MSTELDQEKIDEGLPAVLLDNDQDKIDEGVPAVLLDNDQDKIDEDVPAVLENDQKKIDEGVPAVLLENDQDKIDEGVPAVLENVQEKVDEDVPAVLENVQEKIDEDVPAVLENDQEKIDEGVPAVLIKDSEMKKEVNKYETILIVSDDDDDDDDEEIHFINVSETQSIDTDPSKPVSLPLPIPVDFSIPEALPLPGPYFSDNRIESDSVINEQNRCLSEPLGEPSITIDDLSVNLAQRRCLSAPVDGNPIGCNTHMEVLSSTDERIIDCISLTDSDTDGETSLQQKPNKNLKRKRCMMIPSYVEVENTRKTMKPGPKSKTRNIATVHQMITKAKMMGANLTLDYSDSSDDDMVLDDDSEDENGSSNDDEEELSIMDSNDDENDDEGDDDEGDDDNSDDENDEETEDENKSDENEEKEQPKINPNDDLISIASSIDNATDNLEPEIGESMISREPAASDSSDELAMEILLSLSNEVKINKKTPETLDDMNNKTEALKNVVDPNQIVNYNEKNNVTEQKNIENQNIESHEINSNKITEDENYNNEILKNGE